MKIKPRRVIDLDLSLMESNIINDACAICHRVRWYVHNVETLDAFYERLFEVHSALELERGGNKLCEMLDSLKPYKGSDYTIAIHC